MTTTSASDSADRTAAVTPVATFGPFWVVVTIGSVVVTDCTCVVPENHVYANEVVCPPVPSVLRKWVSGEVVADRAASDLRLELAEVLA